MELLIFIFLMIYFPLFRWFILNVIGIFIIFATAVGGFLLLANL